MKTNGIFCLCPKKKRGSNCDCREACYLKSGGDDKNVVRGKKKRIRGKLNSCCHDIHVFVPARRQFSVQTGAAVWKGVRGILLDTETAECHRSTDILGENKRKERRKKTSLINAPFCQREKKATHFSGRLKSQIKQKREKQSNLRQSCQILTISP